MIGLIQKVIVNPFGKAAAVGEIARGGVERVFSVRRKAALEHHPFGIVGQEVSPGKRDSILLIHPRGERGYPLLEKLRNIGADKAPGKRSAENGRGVYAA